MKALKKIVILTLLAVLVVSYYVHLSSKTAKDVEAVEDTSVVGQLLAVNMDLNYPSTPRDVVLYYSKIIKAFYEEDMTDDQLVGLAQHARATFDAELLAYNEYTVYLENLKNDIADYAANSRKITDYVVDRSSAVEYLTQDGCQYARIKVVYYVKSGSSDRAKSYERYTLRKDEEGKWKILYWELTDEFEVEE